MGRSRRHVLLQCGQRCAFVRDKWLLGDVLRNEWKFDGYDYDSGAVADIIEGHNYTANWTETVAAAIGAGCDVESAKWPKDYPWSTNVPT